LIPVKLVNVPDICPGARHYCARADVALTCKNWEAQPAQSLGKLSKRHRFLSLLLKYTIISSTFLPALNMANSVVPAALGSVIGYVGAEVASTSTFDRLLWPQRFYNYTNLSTIIKTALLMPMGGPLHRAALEVLDAFREQGIYQGKTRGHMLGTAFFTHKKEVRYKWLTAPASEKSKELKEVRNGFWVEVLKNINPHRFLTRNGAIETKTSDQESQPISQRRRTRHYIYYLNLETVEATDIPRNALKVTEHNVTITTLVMVLLSESISIAIALIIAAWTHQYWFTALLMLPLFLKLFTLVVSVRRESLIRPNEAHTLPLSSEMTSGLDIKSAVADTHQENPIQHVFEMNLEHIGPAFITTSSPQTFLQFSRHYGHPLRMSNIDRLREILSIAIVYAFVLIFPAGLVALIWADAKTQDLWLGYQIYAILAIHVARLGGWTGCGRIEEQLANDLEDGKEVYLLGDDGKTSCRAKLKVEHILNMTEVRHRVDTFTSTITR
jgi:hypothetical protein